MLDMRGLSQWAKCWHEGNVGIFCICRQLGQQKFNGFVWCFCGAVLLSTDRWGWTQLAKRAAAVLSRLTREHVLHLNPGWNKMMVVSIFVIRGSYLTTLLPLIFQGAESLFSLQVVLRLSLSPAPLRTPSSVWITLGAGLHGRLNTEEHSGPPISQRERLTHNESSFICMSFIIIPIVSLSMGMLSVNFSMQHSGFSCILSIIPTVSTQPHTSVAVHNIQRNPVPSSRGQSDSA